MRTRKVWRELLGPLLGVGLALLVCGCGGGGSAGKSGTFFAQPVALNSGTATGYVTLSNGRPTAVGMDLTPAVLQGEPPLPLGAASATFGPLPPEASATPFAQIAIGDFPTGHPPVGIGDKPHFHPIFLLNPVQQPDPPNFPAETKPVASGEIPADHVPLADLAPGIGQAYQDPSQPQNQPGWDSFGQNYFFYNGHMNGIALGATDNYLKRMLAGTDIARGDVIKQPNVYPKSGFYPTRYTVAYIAARKVFEFELSDFQQAGQLLSSTPGVRSVSH